MSSGRNNWLAPMAVICIGHLFVDFYVSLLPPLMPSLINNLGLSMTMAGLIFTFMSVSSAWAQPIFGILGDKFKKPWILPLSLFWLALLMGLSGWTKNYITLIIVVTFAGIGSAVYHPIGAVALNSVAGPYKGSATSIYITVGTLGVTLAPLLMPWILKTFGTEGTLFLAIPGILSSIFIYNYLKTHPQKNERKMELPFKEMPALGKRSYWLFLLLLTTGTKLMAINSFSVFMPVYFTELGRGPAFGSYILSLFLLMQSIGGLIGGFLSDIIGKKHTMVLSNIFGFIFFSGFLYTKGILSIALLLIGAAFVKAGFPIAVVMGQDLLPERATFVSGIMMGFTFGLGGFGPVFTGSLTDYLGGDLQIAFVFNLLLILISLGVAIMLPAKIKMDSYRMRNNINQ